MTLVSVFFIACGLAMDAFAVALTNGALLKTLRLKDALTISLYFGSFQGMMPLLGWLIGSRFQALIMKLDHWIAFILLGLIGMKMIDDAVQAKRSGCQQFGKQFSGFEHRTLILLAIATSIDALVVGISFAFLQVAIVEAALLIALVTAVFSFIGVYLGGKCGQLFCGKAELLGGILLIFIGAKILLEHLGYL